MQREEYLKDPCGSLSIPHWKDEGLSLPPDMQIVHHRDFRPERYKDMTDTPYFRLLHDLKGLHAPQIPRGYSLCPADVPAFAEHIRTCYLDTTICARDLEVYTRRAVYAPSLWLAVKADRSEAIVATGIAELDRACGEGVLEWIQVSKHHRGRGLGRYVVAELLWRMKDMARFATVSGECRNPTHPERLYRSCGFTGDDVWHILRRQGETPDGANR